MNGKSQGSRYKNPKSENSVERFRLMWKDVIYEPGELKVVVYKSSKKVGEKVIKTIGEPTQIRLTPDRSIIKGDGQDLSYVFSRGLRC